MKIAYADPPYIGQSKKHYGGIEVNHEQLIYTLVNTFDCWALSLKTNSLKKIMSYCPDNARVFAWLKPYAVIKKNVNPYYSWEPVIISGARPRGDSREYVADAVVCNPTFNSKLVGQKPQDFCFWLFECMGAGLEDDLTDIFPGTGSVSFFLNSGSDKENYLNETK